MKTFNMVKSHFKNFRSHIRERLSTPTVNLAAIGVLWIFSHQLWEEFCLAQLLLLLRNPKWKTSFYVQWISSSLDFCLWICWCWNFIFIWTNFCYQFGNVVLSAYKCKIVWCFIDGDQKKFSLKLFQVLFNMWIT